MNKMERAEPLPTGLEEAYQQLWTELAAQVRSYKNARSKRKRAANAIRAIAFAAFSAGFLLPLANQVVPFSAHAISWGYVSFAVGGLVLLFDQLFTISTGYARLRTTEMRLLDVLYTLELEWAAYHGNASTDHVEAWKILQSASSASRTLNRTQVEEWMADRERSLGVLAGKISAQQATKQ